MSLTIHQIMVPLTSHEIMVHQTVWCLSILGASKYPWNRGASTYLVPLTIHEIMVPLTV